MVSGNSITLTVQARDANGNNLSTGGAAIVFQRTGGTSTGAISGTVDNLNGTYSASFNGGTAGTATSITATANGTPITTGSPSVVVTVGPVSPANSLVTVSSPSVAAGSTVTVTLRARDINTNNLSSGTATVVFNRTGGSSTGTFGTTIDNADGTYTNTFTGVNGGSATAINATVNGIPVATTLPTITVTSGGNSLSNSTVSVSSASVLSGDVVTLSLRVRDASNNNVNGGGSQVVFTAANGTSTGTIGATTDHGNGTYTALFTGVTSGTAATIGALLDGAPVTSTLPTIQVTPGPLSAAASTVSVSQVSLTSGNSVTIIVQAKDAAGNNRTAGGSAVTISHSGGTSTGTISAVTDNNNGTYTATFTGVNAGTATSLVATIAGQTMTSTMPTLTVNPGALSLSQSVVLLSSATVESGSTATITMRAKDAAGNNLTTGGETVVFSRSGGVSTGTFSEVTNNNDGTYTATFTGLAAGSPTTIVATVGGSPLTSVFPTLTVTGGPVSVATSTVSTSAVSTASGGVVVVVLQAKDAAGNNKTSGGATVAFGVAGGTSTGNFSSVTDNLNGTYTANFTGVLAGTATTLTASINSAPVTTPMPTITVTSAGISVATSTLSVSNATVASGNTVTLSLQARDAAGNPISSGGATVAFSHTGGTSTGTIGTTSDHGNGNYTALFTGVISGTTTNIRATIGGVDVTTSSPTVAVTPGALSLANSTVSVSSASVTSGSVVTITMQAKDAAGNNLSSGNDNVVFTASTGSGVSTGTISATNDLNNGVYTASFTGVASGTATTIQATAAGVPLTSTMPTITVSQGSLSLAQSVVTVSSSTVASGASVTLTMQAKDAAGNNLTSGGAGVVFSRANGTST